MEENTYLNNESDSDDFELLNGKKKENQITRKTYFPQKYYKLYILLISIFILFIPRVHKIKELDINNSLNQTQIQTETKNKTQIHTETKNKTQTETETKNITQTETNNKTQIQTETKNITQTETKNRTQTETKNRTQTEDETKTQTKDETKIETKEETKIETKNKTYCLLFNVENVHLLKELGLLAWSMHKYLGYDSFMATYKNGNYDYLKYLPGLRLEFIPNVKRDFVADSLTWLRSNAKRIDVLHLFHMYDRTKRHVELYKQVNPSGKVYLKLDGTVTKQNVFKDTSIIDFISTEFKEYAIEVAKVLKRPIGFVPNPIHPNEIQEFRKFENRKNNIFYVGRVESDKGSHTLLEAFVKIHDKIPNWTLTLAGPINNKLTIAKNFFNIYPNLKGKVIFTGNINDRDRLIELYRSSKIFAFPSRHEGCPISLAEAVSQGCFPVVSDIRPNKLLTNNFKYAYYHERDNTAQLADKLLYACLHEAEIEKLAILGRNAMVERCDLEKCAKTIHEGVFSNELKKK